MPKIQLKKNPRSKGIARRFEKLVNLMFTLRSEGGCPWDRSQSLKDLRQYLLEEAYEVLQAIDQDDQAAAREELGDLLFQVVFLSQVYQEQGTFTLAEVLDHLLAKMIGRHPHVFAGVTAESPEEALQNWEATKNKEKAQQKGNERSVLDGVPLDLPALLQAHLISAKVARLGFDWEKEEDVWKKLEEEIQEFSQADTKEKKEEEMGDLLFTLVNIARKHQINPEDALRIANAKFRKRFGDLEREVYSCNRDWKDFTLDELDEIWEEVKKK